MAVLFEKLKDNLDSLDLELLIFPMSHSHILGINHNQRFLITFQVITHGHIINLRKYIISDLRLLLQKKLRLRSLACLQVLEGELKILYVVLDDETPEEHLLVLGTLDPVLYGLFIVDVAL